MTFDPHTLDTRLRVLSGPSSSDELILDPLAHAISLARTAEGYPCLVFEVDDHPPIIRQSTRALMTTVHPEAELVVDGLRRKSPIVVVALKDGSFQWQFSVLAAEVAACVGVRADTFATSRLVRDHVARWIEVFRRKPMSYEESLGLWGELHVLAMFKDADRAVEVWHGPEAAIFDFGANDVAIEVKTAERHPRHWFDLLQVPEGDRPRVVIASVVTEKNPASGETLADKVQAIRSRLSSPLVFDEKLARVGYDPGVPPDVKVRLSNFAIFAAAVIPRPRDCDEDVVKVKFLADLRTCKPSPEEVFRSLVDVLLGTPPSTR